MLSALQFTKEVIYSGHCDQSAFRRGHSTTTAAHKLFDDLLDNTNEGLINGSCFLDLKKCFDTIDHKLLIKKLISMPSEDLSCCGLRII